MGDRTFEAKAKLLTDCEDVMLSGHDSGYAVAKALKINNATAARYISQVRARWAMRETNSAGGAAQGPYPQRGAGAAPRYLNVAAAVRTNHPNARIGALKLVLAAEERIAKLCGLETVNLAITATAVDCDPRMSFDYALAVARAKIHDEGVAERIADHARRTAAGELLPPMLLEAGHTKFGLDDAKWKPVLRA